MGQDAAFEEGVELVWQADFLFLAAYGALIFFAVWAWLPETLPPDRRQSLHPAELARAYAAVLNHPPFLKLAFALALNFVAFFIYVLTSPIFLIEHLGVSAQGFLWLFGLAMAEMLAGNFLAGRLAGRWSGVRTVKSGLAIMLVAATGNVALNLGMAPQLPWAVLPLALYVFGMSLTVPSISLRILDLFPERRGLVSSCQGATQPTVNALAAGLLVPLVWGSTLSLALTMAAVLALGLLALACCRTAGGGAPPAR